MGTKKTTAIPADVIAAARRRAEQTRSQLAHKPAPAELLTSQELADAAPFYLVLRDYIRQLKEAREAAGVTLAELSTRSGLAVETLSRLETGALTNPTWKTLGMYAAALGLRPRLVLEGGARDGGEETAGGKANRGGRKGREGEKG
jgi:DNA-binding XRE family transcriptional regulator